MAKPIIMPQVGQDIETAVILEWRAGENDSVNAGDIIFVVESEKAVFEIEADEPGVILKILYGEGETAKVFETVAYIGKPGETVEDIPVQEPSGEGENEGIIAKKGHKTSGKTCSDKSQVFATPSAKRAAKEHGIDLSAVRGSGPDGRICRDDVLKTAAVSGADSLQGARIKDGGSGPSGIPGAGDTEIKLTGFRRKIAESLTASKQTIPHFYLSIDVDVTFVLAARKEYNRKAGKHVSFNDIIIQATARTLSSFSRLNAHVHGDKMIVRRDINIGFAVSIDDGLVVPVIPDAANKDISEIGRLTHEMIKNAGKEIPGSHGKASFTVTNLSMYPINYVLPIINPPECAILGIGGIQKRVVPAKGNTGTEIHDIVTLTLACDHRVIDGVYASRFLKSLKKCIERLRFSELS